MWHIHHMPWRINGLGKAERHTVVQCEGCYGKACLLDTIPCFQIIMFYLAQGNRFLPLNMGGHVDIYNCNPPQSLKFTKMLTAFQKNLEK